ncbi:hypothetical protein [Paraburkholderia mimosarum]|uniref:hypothetical protein n=1 Tax=Paraburkholderia mimosarum TaxID=312026 RepID=UPI00047F6E6B|nr:hypothetical protein [Paraburkholderia mimosarum]
MAQDLLVALLNLDAEIKYRMARLTQLNCKTDEPVTAWLEEARAELLADLALLQARREDCFLKLNGVRREPSFGPPPFGDPLPKQTGTRTGSYLRSDPPRPDASARAFDRHVVTPRSRGLHEKRAGSGSRPR